MKKDKPKKNKPDLFTVVVFLAFAAFAVYFFATNQAIVGIIFAFFAFAFLRRIFRF